MKSFLENKWTKIYNQLIDRAKSREIQGYVELHHIIPKCLGGDNSAENLVILTAREHLLAHRLLVKMAATKEIRHKMLGGFWAMAALKNEYSTARQVLTSRQFAKLREDYFASRVGVSPNDETRMKISKALKGRKIPKSTLEKRSATLKENIESGKTKISRSPLTETQKKIRRDKITTTPEQYKERTQKSLITKQQWSDEQKKNYAIKLSTANKGKTRTLEQRQKMSISQTGKKLSEQTKIKISQLQIGKCKDPIMIFTLKNPSGEIIEFCGKARELSKLTSAGIKYLYLSLSNQSAIKRGTGMGWQLLAKRRIKSQS